MCKELLCLISIFTFLFLEHYSVQIGGPNVVVHIDETPINRKHGNRSRSNTVWVIGAVDILNKKAALKFLPSRDHVDVIPFIQDFAAPNSCIHTDSLATYRILTELGFDHHMVNHSIEFVSREGVHTNHIEGI